MEECVEDGAKLFSEIPRAMGGDSRKFILMYVQISFTLKAQKSSWFCGFDKKVEGFHHSQQNSPEVLLNQVESCLSSRLGPHHHSD